MEERKREKKDRVRERERERVGEDELFIFYKNAVSSRSWNRVRFFERTLSQLPENVDSCSEFSGSMMIERIKVVWQTEIGIINYFYNSITYNSQIWLEFLNEPKLITNPIRVFNSVKINY